MKNWIENNQPIQNDVESLSKTLKIPQFICNLLLQRNINSLQVAQDFFRPSFDKLYDPFLMKNMDKVVRKIENSKSEKIMILGDYDVDGTTSTALLYKYFSDRGFNISYYIPDRYKEGYGVSTESIEYAENNDISLIITVDCGIKAVSEVKLANSKEIDIIICDHHLPSDEMPNAHAILNPKQSDCKYPFKELCGCAIAFKIIMAHNQLSSNPVDILEYLDLVALATISDMMPLENENRIMVFYGIKSINEKPRVGLRNFIKSINGPIDESKVSFSIGPRINAAGRMKNAKIVVDLLIEEDINKANILSNNIELLNQNRREAEKNVVFEAEKQLVKNSFSNIVYSKNWSKGVLGIVASRLIEQSYKPTVVFTNSDEKFVTGSVRSVNGFNVYKALSSCKDNIFQYGGHKYAAGLTVKKADLNNFKIQFEKIVKQSANGKMFQKTFSYDLNINFSELTIKNLKIISRMSPFGLGNKRPVFRSNNCIIEDNLKFIGKQSQILKSFVKDESGIKLPFISFNHNDNLKLNTNIDILYTVNINTYSGKEQIELVIKEAN